MSTDGRRVEPDDDGTWGVSLPGPPIEFIDWEEFFTKERGEPEWVFQDVLAKGRLHSIYAQAGLGKSLFTLWMSTRIVSGGGVVIYCDYEMTEDDLYERLLDMGMDSAEALERMRYLLLPNLPPLDTPEGGAALMRVVDSVAHERPGEHITVVIDTIGRAVRGEENSNDTIQGWYQHTGIPIKRRGFTCLRLDHAGWDGGHTRGGSAKRDDVDVIWKMDLTDKGVILKADKRRMAWVPEKIPFEKITEPFLSYRTTRAAWPVGTEELARELERLNLDMKASRRLCRAVMAEHNVSGSNEMVGHAQRFRQAEAKMLAERGWAGYIDNTHDGIDALEDG